MKLEGALESLQVGYVDLLKEFWCLIQTLRENPGDTDTFRKWACAARRRGVPSKLIAERNVDHIVAGGRVVTQELRHSAALFERDPDLERRVMLCEAFILPDLHQRVAQLPFQWKEVGARIQIEGFSDLRGVKILDITPITPRQDRFGFETTVLAVANLQLPRSLREEAHYSQALNDLTEVLDTLGEKLLGAPFRFEVVRSSEPFRFLLRVHFPDNSP